MSLFQSKLTFEEILKMSDKIHSETSKRIFKWIFFSMAIVSIAIIPFLVSIENSYVKDGMQAISGKLSKEGGLRCNKPVDDRFYHYSYTPWSSIGGCGGGGSGGGVGDGIKWIGNGVSGGLIDVEMLSRYNFGQNFTTFSMNPKFSFRPEWTTKVDVIVPVTSKTGEVQYRSNQPAETRGTGGLGDIMLDVSKTFGSSGEYSVELGMGLPTGQYDIKRGSDAAREFLPISLQKGTGLYCPTLSLYYTRDVQGGMWLGNVCFSYPFAARPFTKKNEFLDTYFPMYKDSTQSRRFYYRAKPYGENDLGGFTPPNLGFGVSYAYRGVEHFVHSWNFVFSAPLGVVWIPSEKTNQYNPRPDPDHKAWTAAIAYGLEFSREKFPLFIGVSLPIHSKPSPGKDEMDPKPLAKWTAPDYNDILQQWTIAVGFKSTMF